MFLKFKVSSRRFIGCGSYALFMSVFLLHLLEVANFIKRLEFELTQVLFLTSAKLESFTMALPFLLFSLNTISTVLWGRLLVL